MRITFIFNTISFFILDFFLNFKIIFGNLKRSVLILTNIYLFFLHIIYQIIIYNFKMTKGSLFLLFVAITLSNLIPFILYLRFFLNQEFPLLFIHLILNLILKITF